MANIDLTDVSLTFEVNPPDRSLIKSLIARHVLRRPKAGPIKVQALRNLTLKLEDGTRLGIIGRNGAGKSTLLKVLADIYPPTSGQRLVQGRISSLFDITLGFEVAATGWENIAYRGYLQGETPRSIRNKIHAIAEFSELGEFLHIPVKYYSSGMCVRLAFAIATAIDPEILLIDEAFGAGDTGFRHKARQRIEEIMARARIVVAVNHDLACLRDFCDEVLWLDQGQVKGIGPADSVIAEYTAWIGNQTSKAA